MWGKEYPKVPNFMLISLANIMVKNQRGHDLNNITKEQECILIIIQENNHQNLKGKEISRRIHLNFPPIGHFILKRSYSKHLESLTLTNMYVWINSRRGFKPFTHIAIKSQAFCCVAVLLTGTNNVRGRKRIASLNYEQ